MQPGDWPKIPSILFGIIAPDLPVVFWCPYGAPMNAEAANNLTNGLESVMNFAIKTIVDTQEGATRDAFSCLAKWRENNRIVADLQLDSLDTLA